MNKLFERIFFHNNTTPALNETNLNIMSKAIDDLDNRIINLPVVIGEEAVEKCVEASEKAQEILDSIPADYSELSSDVDELKGIVSNPNLLDNGWFNCNSRGQTQYVGSSKLSYTVDRWALAWFGQLDIIDGGIKLTNTTRTDSAVWSQNFEKALVSTTYTLSAMLVDGRVFSKSGNPTEKELSIGIPDSALQVNATRIKMVVPANKEYQIKAIKLEYGNVSTLANDQAPNVADELIRCITSKADPSDTYANKGVAMGSNPNLLDNGWFTVNQRGQTVYSGAVYGADRWKAQTATSSMTITSDGCKFGVTNDSYIQLTDADNISRLVGKKVTASILLSDGTMYVGSGVLPNNGSEAKSVILIDNDTLMYSIFDFGEGRTKQIARLYFRKEVTIRAIKLEYGGVSTLANDTMPNYDEELRKCQKYYQTLKGYITPACGMVHFYSATAGYAYLKLTTQMNAIKSVVANLSLGILTSGYNTSFVGGTVTNPTIDGDILHFTFSIPSGNVSAGAEKMLFYTSTTEISADL